MKHGAVRFLRDDGYGSRRRFSSGLFLTTLVVTLSHCGSDTPRTLSRARQYFEDTGGANWGAETGGAADATGGVLGTSGGSVATSGTKNATGGVVGTSSVVTVSVSTTAWLSELKIDPPSTDGNNEYIEIAGDPGTTLQGYFLVLLEGDVESNLGQVDKVIDLSNCNGEPCPIGTNGLLLLIAAEGAVLAGESGTSVRIASALVRGGLENGTGYIGLFSGAMPPKVGADWDSNDDGVLEIPSSAIKHDSLTWTDGNAGDALYAVERIGPKPLAQAAFRCGSTNGNFAWYYGLLLGDATSDRPDLAHFVPANLSAAALTPGAVNNCLEPITSSSGTNPDVIVSTGGTSASSPTQPNVGSGGVGSRLTTTLGVGGTGNSYGTVRTIVVEGTRSTDGGESSWWSPTPFIEIAGSAGAALVNDGANAGANGTNEAEQDQPNVPGGCTVVSTSSRETALGIDAFIGLFWLNWWQRRRRRTSKLRVDESQE